MLTKVFFLLIFLFSLSFSWGQTSNFKQDLFLENINDESQLAISLAKNRETYNYIKNNGLEIKHTSQNWIFITISGKKLKTLFNSQIAKYLYTELAEPTMANDTSRFHHQVNEVQQGLNGLQSKFTGKGIVLGYVDTGLDFKHPDFLDSTGKTRVYSYWDQTKTTATSRSPQPYNYGENWTSSEIDNNLCTAVDNVGHGTHVVGISAGNGRANGKHKGMAPEATIVMVQTNNSAKNWTLTVSDACDYIFKIADQLGMPCVINISYGVAMGSHDGNDPASELIEGMLDAKPGRIVVAAAGNNGNLGKYHVHGDVTSDTNFFWVKSTAKGIAGTNSILLEMWADSLKFKDVKFATGANLPSGSYALRGKTKFRTFAEAYAFTPNALRDTIFNENGVKLAYVDYYAEMINHECHMQTAYTKIDSTNYLFQFMSTGSGSYDVWSGTANKVGTKNFNDFETTNIPSPTLYPPIIHYIMADTLQTLFSSYISSEKVMTVGNVSNKASYTTKDGVTTLSVYQPGEIHVSSSKGPNRKGVIKPDIMASGTKIFSANPMSFLNNSANDNKMDIDGYHMLNSGTSMASPLVAGIAALYLEKCSNATYSDFKNDVIATAKTLAIQGSIPNNAYGNGEINALSLLLKTNAKPSLSGNTIITCKNTPSISVSSDRGISSIIWSDTDTKTTKSFLTPGKFGFQITDSKNCTYRDTVTITKAPDLITKVKYLGDSILSCKNQTVNLYATGGVSYVWSGGNSVLNDTITFNQAGKYTLTTTDVNGCSKVDTVLIKNSTLSSNLKITYVGDSILNCSNKSVKVNIATGNSILWSGGSDITNDTNQFTLPGTYSVTITDSNNCVYKDSITIVQDTVQPKITFTFIGDSLLTCVTKSIIIKSSGGNSFTWNGGQIISNDSIKFTSPGIYVCTSTGLNGCLKKDSLHIKIDTIKPKLQFGFIGNSKLTCTTKNVKVKVTGAQNYVWDDGKNPTNDTNEFSLKGTYHVIGTAINGCSLKDSITIQQDTLLPSIKTTFLGDSTLTCSKTTVTAIASGGVSYKWYAGNQPTKDTNSFIQAGIYNVEVTGNNGCISIKNINITQDTVTPILKLSAPNGFTINCSKPSLTLLASGASSYIWTGGLMKNLDSSEFIQAGNFSLKGFGTNGCATQKSFQIVADTMKPTITLQFQGDSIITCINKSVRVSMMGAQSYAWNGGDVFANNVQEFTKEGVYQLVSTGFNSCQRIQTIKITKDTLLPNISKSLGIPSFLTCSNKNVQATINGASIVQWDGGKTPQNNTNQFDVPGVYHFIANNSNGCLVNDSITILSDTIPLKSSIIVLNQKSLTCDNKRVYVQATGGVSYSWNGGNSLKTDTNSFITPGNYIVSVIDNKGCTSVQNILVQEDITSPTITINLLSSAYISCDNDPVKVKVVGAKSYVWNGGNNLFLDTNTFVNPGKYSVTATGQNGCISKDSITVVQHAYPATPTITQKDSLLIASISPNYQWYVDGDLLPNETKQTIVYTIGKTYFVSVESTGCIATSKFYTPTISGISQQTLMQINAYPNPTTNGRFFLQGIQQGDQLSAYDLLGNKITLEQLSNNEYQLESLADGVYFVAIERNSNRMLVKIVKN